MGGNKKKSHKAEKKKKIGVVELCTQLSNAQKMPLFQRNEKIKSLIYLVLQCTFIT